jgi:transcriptional regulator GlxA family with amidase domain
LAALPRPDLAIVTDLTLPLDADPRGRWPEVTAWLRARFAQGTTVCSVRTGSVLLAEAGLLDGAEATTHWGAIPLFRAYYSNPKSVVDVGWVSAQRLTQHNQYVGLRPTA